MFSFAGEVSGVQIGILSSAEEFVGLQVGILSAAKEFVGLQVAGVSTSENHKGVSFSMISQVANEMAGVRFALANIGNRYYSEAACYGVQVGVVNTESPYIGLGICNRD